MRGLNLKLARIFGAFLVALAFAANAINAEEIGNGEAAIIVIKDEFASKLTIDGRPAKWFAHPAKKGYKVAFFSASYRAKKDIKVNPHGLTRGARYYGGVNHAE